MRHWKKLFIQFHWSVSYCHDEKIKWYCFFLRQTLQVWSGVTPRIAFEEFLFYRTLRTAGEVVVEYCLRETFLPSIWQRFYHYRCISCCVNNINQTIIPIFIKTAIKTLLCNLFLLNRLIIVLIIQYTKRIIGIYAPIA